MRKIKFILLISILSITVHSCGSIKEGFKSQKKNSTDEFLVEKKSPLVMPPEFNQLPVPDASEAKDDFTNLDNSNNIEKLLTDGAKIDDTIDQNKNFENSIIDQIKNN